jgi:aminomethyltransferase
MSHLKRTALHDCHLESGAKMVGFAGWDMPVHYSSLLTEHRAVRRAAGLFDVSHMGEIRVTGPHAETFLQGLTPNDVSRLTPGAAHYSALLSDAGTFIDDLLVYRLSDGDFMLVVNAANREADMAWVSSHAPGGIAVDDVSDSTALLSLQGPRAAAILDPLTPCDLPAIRYYRFVDGEVSGAPALISRTGYTGEDGFEIYLEPDSAPGVWRDILDSGSREGLLPAGLGARDTLRLEAGLALYGHEIDRSTTPFEVGLGWVVKMKKGDFVGRNALAAHLAEGPKRKLVGFEVCDRGIARAEHPVLCGGRTVGRVTSGTWSPTFEKSLGLALLSIEVSSPGTELQVDVRGKLLDCRVTEYPFYRRRE